MLKGWTAYHLTIVAIFTLAMMYLGINALMMKNSGGYELSAEAELPYGVEQLWQWTIENEKRAKWQVGMYDLSKLRGEPAEVESTRMLFFRSGADKWSGAEITLESQRPLKWVSRQELPTVQRIYTISHEKLGPCLTKVTVHEKAAFFDFNERFWLFWTKRDHQERLNYSLRQLKTWMGHKKETCKVG